MDYTQKVNEILQKEQLSQQTKTSVIQLVSELQSDHVHQQDLNYSISGKYDMACLQLKK